MHLSVLGKSNHAMLVVCWLGQTIKCSDEVSRDRKLHDQAVWNQEVRVI